MSEEPVTLTVDNLTEITDELEVGEEVDILVDSETGEVLGTEEVEGPNRAQRRQAERDWFGWMNPLSAERIKAEKQEKLERTRAKRRKKNKTARASRKKNRR